MNAFLKQTVSAAFSLLAFVAVGVNASPLPNGDLYVDDADGILLSPDGEVDGLPHMAGTYESTVFVKDTEGQTASTTLTLAQALDATDLVWTTGGDAEWSAEWSEEAVEGIHDARSGVIGDAAESWIETCVFGPGTLSFSWRISCENRFDYALLEINGAIRARLSGETDWTTVTNNLSEGLHTIRWTYRKNRSGNSGEDALWLDAVSWRPEPMPTLAEALDATNLVWMTGGDESWSVLRGEFAFDGQACGVSGPIGDCGSSWLRTFVMGPGTFSFRWRVSSEDGYDWFDFLLDGEFADTLTGESEWVSVSFNVPEGLHELAWEYWKDEMDEDGLTCEDCAMLDQVCFEPADNGVVSGEDVIRAEFLDFLFQNDLLFAGAGEEDINAAATSDTDGDGMTAWAEFVAGTKPNDPASFFRARIALENGVPVVTWEPDLTPERDYVIYASDSVGGEWRELPEGEMTVIKESGFFRVKAFLPGVRGESPSGKSASPQEPVP